MNPRAYLDHLEFHGIKLGLDAIRRLLAALGDPHRTFSAVHVAGTNAKGSVLAFLDAMLRAAGYRTGRFTSPHLLDVTERFLVDSRPMASAELDRIIRLCQAHVAQWDPPPTYFELCTAIAYQWFAEQAVDLALVEVGMGGRFDSTNVITPRAAAITNIDLEHTQYLGDTLAKIAFEKAGILKPNVPAVVGLCKPEAMAVIEAEAAKRPCPLVRVGRDIRFTVEGTALTPALTCTGPRRAFQRVPLGLAGRFQGENAAVAIGLAELLTDAFPRLDGAAMEQGLRNARWPCRLERVLDAPPVYIDVAHNPAGAAQLAANLEQPCVIVLAVSADKDAAAMASALAPFAAPLIVSQFEGPRAMPAAALSRAAGPTPHRCITRLSDAVDAGIDEAAEGKPLLITGSIFTAAEARRWLIARWGARPLDFG